ncbi:MAG: hypothetical protein LBC20_00700 [Planctomycetaceae bacterium]|jgi:hypothetical protein|nr:hypothetical protein [Planctomycetaceae bacterium]
MLKNKHLMQLIPLIIIGCMIFVAVGCAPALRPLEGIVAYDGQPLAQGSITLTPDGTKGNYGKPTMGAIKNGKFSIPQKFGIFEGTYNITVTEAVPVSDPDDPNPPANFQHLFSSYTIRHTFSASESNPTITIDIPKTKGKVGY